MQTRELESYRDNYADLLEYFGGKRILTLTEVARYTGKDRRWCQSRYLINPKDGISIPTLARKLVKT